jgi:hypothetical protein
MTDIPVLSKAPGAEIDPRDRRRRAVRYPCAADIRLAWSSNFDRYAVGECVNISRTGLGMVIAHPIPNRTNVSFKSECLALAGSASVRFCKKDKNKYVVGLDFAGGLAWRPTAANDCGAVNWPVQPPEAGL